MSASYWAKSVNRWHDEVGPLHLRNDDLSTACGARYYACAGSVPGDTGPRCARCVRIAVKRSKTAAEGA